MAHGRKQKRLDALTEKLDAINEGEIEATDIEKEKIQFKIDALEKILGV